jgi:predicted DNA binding CopG/RHH family protein
MEKKQHASSVRGAHRSASVKLTEDKDIDFSEIPESTRAELKRAVRVGRPATGNAKHLIAFRIAPGLLAKIKKLAAKQDTPYQTYLHKLLEDAVDRKAA